MTGSGFRDLAPPGSQHAMSAEDRLKNKIEDLGGRAEQPLGKATGEKVKDAFRK